LTAFEEMGHDAAPAAAGAKAAGDAIAADFQAAAVGLGAPTRPWPRPWFGSLVGGSLEMRLLYTQLARVARADATVLLQGETGTGKELAAKAVHDASARAARPFVVIDCGALPETLLEAELFGHARGAFTGATDARAGAIEQAEGGTVFLDEIGELPLGVQPKLLRVLESRTVRRLGETHHRKVDVRFVSATHRDLAALAAARAFREDLYFRLAVLPVAIPPLRERPSDIPALIRHFLPAGDGAVIPPELMLELAARPWPGNVRELRNFVERTRVLGAGAALAVDVPTDAAAFTPAAVAVTGRDEPGALAPELLALPFKVVRDRLLGEIERAYVAGIIDRHGHNVSAAAKASGLNRSYLHRLMRRHGI
jgi:transcriptional regulator with GAF, ATPase, and Fis domain